MGNERSRKVNLSKLPHNKNNRIIWKRSVGCKIPFVYDGIKGTIVIDEWCDDGHIKITIPDYVSNYKITTSGILKGQLGTALGFETGTNFVDFALNVGDIFDNDIKILEQITKVKKSGKYNKKLKYYKCQCLKDGRIWEVSERNLLKKVSRCPYCSNSKVLVGINDINTTHPEIAKLFKNEEDKHKYTAGSHQKVVFKCPICGDEREVVIINAVTHGYTCLKCKDCTSYPNKFVLNVILQIYEKNNLDKQSIIREFPIRWDEHTFVSWKPINKRKKKNMIYDIFLQDKNIIIENQGGQHFVDTNFSKYEQQKENDIQKEFLAKRKGIQYYIKIDCTESKKEYIKRSIMASELPQLLNFKESDIDWDKAEEYARFSLMIRAYILYYKENKTIKEISSEIYIPQNRVEAYIEKVINMGLNL